MHRLKGEMELRTQGSRPKLRPQKNLRPGPRTDLPRTDPFEAKNRNARGQEQCASVFRKKGLRSKKLQIFREIQEFSKKQNNNNNNKTNKNKKKKGIQKFSVKSLACFKTKKKKWLWLWPIFNKSKNSAVLESRTGHFRGLAGFVAKDLISTPSPWTSNWVHEDSTSD